MHTHYREEGTVASNQKRIVKRIIEKGNRHYTFGIFESTGMGTRRLIAIVEGTYQDAVKLMHADRTESGHSFKGFKKLKTSD